MLSNSCSWELLHRWLDRNHPSQVLYSLPPSSLSRSTAMQIYAHVQRTVQRWCQGPGEALVINEDGSEDDELEPEDDDAAFEDAADATKPSP